MQRSQVTVAIFLALIVSPAYAYLGACKPGDIGTSVTMCDACNRTKCVPKSTVDKRSGWLVGRCFGEPMACTNGQPDSVCCVYSNGSLSTAGSADECPKCDASGAVLTQSIEGMHADTASRQCVFDEPTVTPKFQALAFSSSSAITMRVIGGTSADPGQCLPSLGIACCINYNATFGSFVSDQTDCSLCGSNPDYTGSCLANNYASGDGKFCIPAGQ